jgi:hypothetical protein
MNAALLQHPTFFAMTKCLVSRTPLLYLHISVEFMAGGELTKRQLKGKQAKLEIVVKLERT